MYVYDTPGIMLPYIRDMDVGMKLAMCGNDVVPVLLYTLYRSLFIVLMLVFCTFFMVYCSF